MTDKIVTPQQVDLQNRKNKFMIEVDKLGAKYRINVIPKLMYSPEGIIPVLSVEDRIPTVQPPTSPQSNEKE